MRKVELLSSDPNVRDDDFFTGIAEKYHTPLYVFDERTIRARIADLKSAIGYKNYKIRYAAKALTLREILRIMLDEGLWIDASSVNEVHRALRAGFNTSEIYYTGEGASTDVYRFLVEKDVLINCTSLDQIRLLGAVRPGHHCSIRINPGKGHGGNNKTTTGGPNSKHGIYKTQIDEARAIAAEHNIKIIGIHSHIGSGSDPAQWPLWNTINERVIEIARNFGPDLEFVNLGGGLPVAYEPDQQSMDVRQWGEKLTHDMSKLSKDIGRDVRLFIEPGRYLVAESGYLLAEVQSLKVNPPDEGIPGYNYVIVNTGLNHNIRPAMYGAYHHIYFIPKGDGAREGKKEYVVAGYLCESGDVFTVGEGEILKPRTFPEVKVGDLMVMSHVGAYSHAMKSDYNSMNLPASVLIDATGRPRIIERRGTLDDIMLRELEAYVEGRDVGM